jgi:hypothetical protein
MEVIRIIFKPKAGQTNGGGAEGTPRDLVCRAMTEPPFLSMVTVVTNMADQ